MWGYENNGMIGLPIGALMGDTDEAVPGTWLKNYLNSGANIGIRTELVARQYDGSPFPMEMRISETLTGDKRIYTACVRDISDRKRAEGRLRLLSSVAQESLSGILIMDLEEHIVFANPAFERLSGYRAETVIGSRLESFLFGPDTAYHSRR